MLRQVLTLLAVISGLALVAEPARALDSDIVSIAEAAEKDCEIKGSAPAQLIGLVTKRNGEKRKKPCRELRPIIWTPTVQLQADRARE